jgi:hypothetical protein
MTVKTFSELFLEQPPTDICRVASGAATIPALSPPLRFTAPTALIPSSLTLSLKYSRSERMVFGIGTSPWNCRKFSPVLTAAVSGTLYLAALTAPSPLTISSEY